MNIKQKDPYTIIIVVIAVIIAGAVLLALKDTLFALLGGGLVLYVTLILPFAVAFFLIEKIYNSFKNK